MDLIELIERHGLSAHLYADDTQVYGSCRPTDVVSFSTTLTGCVDETASWLKSNRLQSNPDKAEVLWCATNRRQHQLPTTPLSIKGAAVAPVKSVRDLGIYIDADLITRTHPTNGVADSQCFAALRKLRQIRRSVPPATFQSLVVTLVLADETALRKCCTGWPTSIPCTATTVGAECGRTGDLSPAICRSYH